MDNGGFEASSFADLSGLLSKFGRNSHKVLCDFVFFRKKFPGDVYYIISIDWWNTWERYVKEVANEGVNDGDAGHSNGGRKRSNALSYATDLIRDLPSPFKQTSRASTPTLSRSSSTMSVQLRHPGHINNQPLLVTDRSGLKSMTDEGGSPA